MQRIILSFAIISCFFLPGCAGPFQKSDAALFKDLGQTVSVRPLTPESIDDYCIGSQRHGLRWGEAWLSVSLLSAGGQRYGLVRGYEESASNLMLSFKMRDDLDDVSSRLFDRLYTGKIAFDRVEGQDAAVVSAADKQHSFRIELNVNRISWQEDDGAVDLRLESLGPAMSYYIPAGRTKEELYYTAEIFRVTGSLCGEEVSGYGSLDQVWLPEGIDWFQSKGFLFFEDLWLVWANRYADGSTDYGVVIAGPENWNVCFYVDGGQIHTPADNAIVAQWAAEGYPRQVDVAMAADKLRFQWNCERRILEVKDTGLWANGRMRNLAKTAEPVEGYAWVEAIRFHERNLPYPVTKFASLCVMHLPDRLKSRVYEMMFARGMND